MAKRIDAALKYPWDEWADGSTWIAEQGVDFFCSEVSFRSALHSQARYTGRKVTTKIKGDSVIFQFKDA